MTYLINQINILGEIGMNKDLDDLSTALLNGELPAMWRRMTSQVICR